MNHLCQVRVEKIVNLKHTIDVVFHPLAKMLGVEGVAGSNPVGPTKALSQ
jgi:hypothetical protein